MTGTFPEFRTSTGYFSNSTGSSVTTRSDLPVRVLTCLILGISKKEYQEDNVFRRDWNTVAYKQLRPKIILKIGKEKIRKL